MSENNEYMPDLFTLVDEEGVEQVFEQLDEMEVDGELYHALVPYYENPEEMLSDSDELVILKSVYEDEEEILVTIDDDDEFNRIGEIFMERIEEMYSCDDDECDCGCEHHNHDEE